MTKALLVMRKMNQILVKPATAVRKRRVPPRALDWKLATSARPSERIPTRALQTSDFVHDLNRPVNIRSDLEASQTRPN
ncbi:MAG TPA: hypothetical protein VI306_06475 [Pyrinomonadaceae bacterium]